MPISFIFATCDKDASPVFKHEMSQKYPEFRLAYSRPGFLTFKIETRKTLDSTFELDTVFAHAYGISLGKIETQDVPTAARQIKVRAGELGINQAHVWSRDSSTEDEAALLHALQEQGLKVNGQVPPIKEQVLDVILVSPSEWWLGLHTHTKNHRPWPGGCYPLKLPAEAPSRAYLKFSEALDWSELKIKPKDVALELGSAPGGASLVLLERGLQVVGVDPADMSSAVTKKSGFVHLRRQALQVCAKDLKNPPRWLIADMNISPEELFKVVSKMRALAAFEGALFMLKLSDWKVAHKIPDWLEQLRKKEGWAQVKAAHLFHNRREVCVVCLAS